MRGLKYFVFALGGVVALVVAAIAYVAATFDANKWKGEIAQLVQDKKSRSLRIDGDLSLSFFPGIGVKLAKASLSEHKSEQRFAAIESARVSLRILPLLRKQIVVDTVELTGLSATLVRFKDGSTNIDDLLAKDPNEPPTRFDIGGVKIANAQLTYRDEKSGQSFALSGLALETGRLANAAQGKMALSVRLSAEQPKLDSELKIGGRYDYDLERKIYGADALEAKITGDIAGMKGLGVDLAAGQLRFQAATGELALAGLSLAAKGKAGGDSVEFKLEAPQLSLASGKAAGAAVNAVLKLAGAQRKVDAKLALSGIEGTSQALKVAKLTLDLDAHQGETSVRGGLSSLLAANLGAQTVELPAFSGEFTLAGPRMPMKSVKLPVAGSLRADFARQTAAANATARFDESRIQAKFNLARFRPLALGFDVDIDRLNVDKYSPPSAPKLAAAGKQQESPLDFSALKGLDASGSLRIGQLQVANVKASNVRLEIKAADGRIDVAPHSANLYNGSVSGALLVNANNNQVALKQTLSNVSINPLMKDALDKDLLEGRGNVTLDIATGGNTASAMKKALRGTASVNLKDGAIKGINLAQSLRQTKALFSGRTDAVQQARAGDKTDFSELAASFRIANGVARNEDLNVKSPFLRLGGAGDIDIGNGRMNYVAKASVVGTSGGQGGKDLEHLKGLTVPVRVSGPFDNLSYRLEFASLVGEAAKAKVEEKVKEKARESLKEGLKGLFGK